MNLQEEWNMMSEEINLKGDLLPSVDKAAVRADANNVLRNLKRNLRIKGWWGMAIATAALIGFIVVSGEAKYWLLGVFVVYGIIPYVLMGKSLSLSRRDIDLSQATVGVLSDQAKVIKAVLRGDRIWEYIVIPLYGPCGLITSSLLLGNTLEGIFSATPLIIIMVICLVGGIPLARWSVKMNYRVFGKYLEKLEDNITVLQGK
jgi:hypothetical protein